MTGFKALFAGLNEAQIEEMIRHECGHLLVARALGWKTGDIVLTARNAGACIELHPSFKQLEEAIPWMEKRVQVLYGGALAQSLDGNNRVQRDHCKRFLNEGGNATDDMAKIREVLRILVGMKHRELDRAAFEKQLETTVNELSLAAAKIVEKHAPTIRELTREFIVQVKGVTSLTIKAPSQINLSAQRIDKLLTAKGL